MHVRQCARCAKLFQFRGSLNCPGCVQELDETFTKVRNFLEDNPRANIEDVCQASGAEEDDVLRWLREGRLILTRESTPLLTCQLCLAPIQSGRYCDSCSYKVIGQLEDTADHLRKADGKKRVHVIRNE